ncbi:40S ribosomal protein S3-1 isoform X5 [Phoenix dactylifera]|uniref:Small ribosomal subunit protein uS3 n=1 Tax=Phoenix dactylifera TaxID=42345 RepID=A0A8B9AIH1_PHODC|nr:40S ribosomal protein S3-1 isoform X5 [Phoenix dactylifera]
MATQISKKRKFVADGVFFAELNEVLTRELAEDGYSGVEVRVTPMRTEIIIRATRTQNVLGEKGRRIRELTSVVQKRFNFPENSVELYAEKVNNRGLWAIAQAESLRYKLLGGLAVRRACYGVLRFIMESGAKGCEVIVSGKLRAQRAKSMKFKDGYMISSGQPVNEYIDSAVRHVLLRQFSFIRVFLGSRSRLGWIGIQRASKALQHLCQIWSLFTRQRMRMSI